MAGRSIRVTPEMKEDAMKLVRLMGVPVIDAPGEAEAQCAEIVKMGLATGTATEDMDALTFGTKFLYRGFNSKKEPICIVDLEKMLKGFEMTQKEFIDLCILCGCDYTQTIGGIGPITAMKLLKEHKDIEGVIKKCTRANEDSNKKRKYVIPDKFMFEESRKLFEEPLVIKDKEEIERQLVWNKPDELELKEWLIGRRSFTEVKVDNGIARILKC